MSGPLEGGNPLRTLLATTPAAAPQASPNPLRQKLSKPAVVAGNPLRALLGGATAGAAAAGAVPAPTPRPNILDEMARSAGLRKTFLEAEQKKVWPTHFDTQNPDQLAALAHNVQVLPRWGLKAVGEGFNIVNRALMPANLALGDPIGAAGRALKAGAEKAKRWQQSPDYNRAHAVTQAEIERREGMGSVPNDYDGSGMIRPVPLPSSKPFLRTTGPIDPRIEQARQAVQQELYSDPRSTETAAQEWARRLLGDVADPRIPTIGEHLGEASGDPYLGMGLDMVVPWGPLASASKLAQGVRGAARFLGGQGTRLTRAELLAQHAAEQARLTQAGLEAAQRAQTARVANTAARAGMPRLAGAEQSARNVPIVQGRLSIPEAGAVDPTEEIRSLMAAFNRPAAPKLRIPEAAPEVVRPKLLIPEAAAQAPPKLHIPEAGETPGNPLRALLEGGPTPALPHAPTPEYLATLKPKKGRQLKPATLGQGDVFQGPATSPASVNPLRALLEKQEPPEPGPWKAPEVAPPLRPDLEYRPGPAAAPAPPPAPPYAPDPFAGVDPAQRMGEVFRSAAHRLGFSPQYISRKFGMGLGANEVEKVFAGTGSPEQVQMVTRALGMEFGPQGMRWKPPSDAKLKAATLRNWNEQMELARAWQIVAPPDPMKVAPLRAGAQAAHLRRAAEAPRPASFFDEATAPGDLRAGARSETFMPQDLQVDAKAYQFKAGGDAAGVTDALRGVRTWDRSKSGKAIVHERLDGGYYIADGHQRHGLATRLTREGQPAAIDALVYREADGYSIADVRRIAAAKNLAEGTGSAIDAAKVAREVGVDHPDLASIPKSKPIYRDGEQLAKLGDRAFEEVVNGTVKPDYAAHVGRLIQGDAAQLAALKALRRLKPASTGEALSIVQDIRAQGLARKTEQGGLFGAEEMMEDLLGERAKIFAAAQSIAETDKSLFKWIVRGEGRFQEAGNVLAGEANRAHVTDAERVLAGLEEVKYVGPVARRLNELARELKAGTITDRAAAKSFLESVRSESAVADAARARPGRPALEPGRGVDDIEPVPDIEGQDTFFSMEQARRTRRPVGYHGPSEADIYASVNRKKTLSIPEAVRRMSGGAQAAGRAAMQAMVEGRGWKAVIQDTLGTFRGDVENAMLVAKITGYDNLDEVKRLAVEFAQRNRQKAVGVWETGTGRHSRLRLLMEDTDIERVQRLLRSMGSEYHTLVREGDQLWLHLVSQDDEAADAAKVLANKLLEDDHAARMVSEKGTADFIDKRDYWRHRPSGPNPRRPVPQGSRQDYDRGRSDSARSGDYSGRRGPVDSEGSDFYSIEQGPGRMGQRSPREPKGQGRLLPDAPGPGPGPKPGERMPAPYELAGQKVHLGRMDVARRLPMPALVRLSKTLTGSVPDVSNALKALSRKMGARVNGRFSGGRVEINPDLFANEDLAAKVLGHEIGHVLDVLGGPKAAAGKAVRSELAKQLAKEPELLREAIKLSEEWRPYDRAGATREFLRYREMPEEVIADFVSVFLNDAALAQKQAPKLTQAFFQSLDKRPDALKALVEVHDMMSGTMGDFVAGLERDLDASFASAEDIWRGIREQEAARRASTWERFSQQIRYLFSDTKGEYKRRAQKLEDQGVKLAPHQDPRVSFDEASYSANKRFLLARDWQDKIVEPLRAAGVEETELGRYLFAQRIANGDRKALANPLGIGPREAKAIIRRAENSDVLKQAAKAVRKLYSQALDDALDAGAVGRQEYEAAKSGLGGWAEFALVDDLQGRIPPEIRAQSGSFLDVANPATASFMKVLALRNLAESNRARAAAVKFIVDHYPEEAKLVKAGTRIPFGQAEFRVIEDGKSVTYHVDEWISQSFDGERFDVLAQVARTLAVLDHKVFKPLWITWNLGFQLMNVLRDAQRSTRGFSALGVTSPWRPDNFFRTLASYKGALPHAWTYAKGELDGLLREMVEDYAIAPPGESLTDMIGGTQMEHLLGQHGGIGPRPTRQGLAKALVPVEATLDFLQTIGRTLEAVPKVAGYQRLGQANITGPVRARIVRDYVGTPNFRIKGAATPVTNNILIFSNIALQSWKADAQLLLGPRTRSGAWIEMVKHALMPKMLMAAASYGAFEHLSPGLKEMYDAIGEYDKTQFLCIPMGWEEGGEHGKRVRYIRIPLDETARFFGGLAWKAAHGPQSGKDLEDWAADTFKFAAGQLVPDAGPTAKMIGVASQVAQGNNPDDDFTGRPIVRKKEFDAGGWPRWRGVLRWGVGQFGMVGEIVRNQMDEGSTKQAYSWTMATPPGLNRFFRVSDRGFSEAQQQDKHNVEKAKAQLKTGYGDKTKELIGTHARLQQLGRDRRTAVQEQAYRTAGRFAKGDYRRTQQRIQRLLEDGHELDAARLQAKLERDADRYYRDLNKLTGRTER